MIYDNNTTQLRRELLIRITKSFLAGSLKEDADRIPLLLRPREGENTRCCVYRDRAIIKYRCLAVLGIGVEDEKDEAKSLAAYADDALQRETVEGPVLTVLDEACSACVQSNYFVTDACRGCLARPCTLNCPKEAISIVNHRAQIDIHRCVNCGRCKQVCPYHAIIYVPIPCEKDCPVGAISKGEGGKEQIDQEKCIHCGACLRACPFGAIMEKSQIIDVLRAIRGDRPVVAMIAPAILGQFPASLEQISKALHSAGFSSVAEVAWGADQVAQKEAEEFSQRMQDGQKLMTTSCCYAYTEMVRKHLPEMQPFVSHTPTPLFLTARRVAEDYPDSVRVFIGPCVAKKNEGLADPFVDYVLSFEELGALFVAKDIQVESCEPEDTNLQGTRTGRGFPLSGGVCASVQQHLDPDETFRPELINGLSRQAFKRLKIYPKLKDAANFLEVMACEGGCIGGPCVICNAGIAEKKVIQELGKNTEES